MKRLIAKSLMLAGGLTLSSQLMALGLGEMTLKSALNQPLNAEIDLVDADDLSKWEIKPSLATAADFERAGVDRVFFLTKIKFNVEDGKVVLTSREAVTEPFLNFLVELNWPSGRVLREYTVLLDPPVFEEETIQPLVVAPATSNITSTAQADFDQPSSAAFSRSGNDWLDKPAAPGTYKVQPNDTLWEIALQTRPDSGVSAQQMMLAIQQQNPNAFIGGNINRLKTHQVLRIPDAEQVDQIRFGQAVAEVERQNQALSGGAAQLDATGRRTEAAPDTTANGGGEVRLLSSGQDNAESAGASGDTSGVDGNGRQQAIENDLAIALETLDKSRLENQELRQRLESLEEQIATLQRLITLKDDQLASIQVNEAQTQQTEDSAGIDAALPEGEAIAANVDVADASIADDTLTETVDAVDGEQSIAADNEGSVDEGAGTPADPVAGAEEEVDFNYQDEAAAQQAKADAAEEEARRQRIAALIAQQEAENRPQPSMIDTMLQRPELLGGALAFLLLIVLGVYKLVQNRKAAKQEESAEEASAAMFEDGPVDGSDLDDLDFDDTDLDAAELDMAHDDAGLGGDDDFDLGDMDEQPEGDFGSVAQTEDVISESDIYIAYGKFEQAVDLLTAAIDQEPSRSDLRLKLLEVYVEMDDADAFAQQEGQLNGIGDDEANQQAEQMRSRLSTPISPLAGGQSDALSLDQDIPSLDDSLGEEFSEGLDFGDALDLADGEGMPSDELDLDLGEESSSESLEFDLSGTDTSDDIPSLDEEASLEDVPTLDLDETLEFDLSADSAELELNESDSSDDELSSFDDVEDDAEDDSLEFDLSGLENVGDDDAESDTQANAEEEAADDSLEFDLGSLAAGDDDSGLEDLLGESGDDEVIDISDDIADISGGAEAADSDSDLADLESLMDAEGSIGEPELPDLSFEMDEETGFSESADDDLKALEAELDSAAETQADIVETDVDDSVDELVDAAVDSEAGDSDGEAVEGVIDEAADEPAVDFAADLAELDAELDDFDAAPQDQELPVVDDVAEQVAVDGDKDIDLDKLAAAEDEFDFLAGTDECATKLDLARAYIDMEDMDGARELLQEVLQEGSDQQKQDARSLMDNMS